VRIVEKLVGQSVTPKQQANAAYCCAVMRTDAETMDVPMGQLNRYITELRTLVKLKNDYDCRMSYAQFKKETTESICYRILDRVQAVEMLRSSVDKFARPYMTEHKLPADDTLYRYILDVAKNSIGTMTAGNPWEDRCLAIVDSITSTKLRCQSVIAVVKRAKLPWSRQLHTVVQRMLNECDSKELVDELRQQCRLAELKQLFSKYLVPSDSLSKCLASSTKFDRLIAHMIAQEAIGSEKSRLDDALLAVELNPIASKMRVLISFGYRLVQTATQDNLSSLVAFVDSLEKAEGAAVATRLLQKIRERLDVPLGLEKSERIKLIEAALCLAQRFAGETVLIADDISAMAADLRSVRALQTKYDIMTSLAEFGHSTFKRQTLSDYINEGGRQKSWAEVIEFAATLLLSRLDTCEIAMKCAMGARNPHLMLQVLDDLLLNHGDHLLGDIVNMAINACRCSLEYLALLPDQGLNLVVELVQTLHKLLPKVIVICRKEPDLRFLLKLTAYVDFFMQVINQCLVDETAESGGDGGTEVRGIHRRLGDYRFSSDGALFDKEGAVRAVAMLAPSLLGNSATAEADWSTLLSLLSMHNQSMLEMSARLLKLAVFQLVARADFDELEPCVETLCEKIVLRSPADLNLAGGALLSLSLAQGRNAMNNLRRRVANGRKPRAMLSLVLLGQLTAGRAGDTAVIGMLKEAYAWNIWAKRLGKYGAQMPPGRNYISAVNQFARKKIPIDVLGEFCADFDLSLSDASLVYVLALLEQCREDADELESMRLADLALRSVRPSATVVEKLHQLLRSIDPYRYALIDFVLSKMSQLKTDEAVLPVPLTKLISLLHFLADYERVKKPMAEEVSWYAQKMKQSDCAETAEGMDSEPMDESTMDGLYEKPTTPCVNVSSATLPTASNIRLPFHAFLPDNQVCLFF
uniref:Uncharacterized protein n=1 Tax=Plectus sambesii TaxID=2011161 RepID=A0A914XPX7_9BILA